jgi:HAD superfamily hydrolase (TIGR01549 family)
MIRAVIFDLGGVLLRTENPQPREQLARSLGMTRPELETLVFDGPSGRAAQTGEFPVARHWENVAQELGLSSADMRAFQDAFWGGDRMDADLVDWLRAQRGPYRTGLLSNAFSDLRHFLTQVWRIEDAFDHMVISAEVGRVKPEPEIYHLALEGLGVAAHEAVFVDDFIENVDGARQEGLAAIHFQDAGQARAALEKLLAQDSGA